MVLRFLEKVLRVLGLKIIRDSSWLLLLEENKGYAKQIRRANADLERSKLRNSNVTSLVSQLKSSEIPPKVAFDSTSQLGQDLLAVAITSAKRGGFFVEFGACDGLSFSNTYILEKHYGWSGILAEPSPQWAKELEQNRSAAKDYRAVFSSSGRVVRLLQMREAGALEGFGLEDLHQRSGEFVEVETVSLHDLLLHHKAPQHIDYLSIDVEGAEFEILSGFNFSDYSFSLITLEHNFTAQGERAIEIVERAGYQRIFPELSDFDAWFVPRTRPVGELP